jgi:hypothetical protein
MHSNCSVTTHKIKFNHLQSLEKKRKDGNGGGCEAICFRHRLDWQQMEATWDMMKSTPLQFPNLAKPWIKWLWWICHWKSIWFYKGCGTGHLYLATWWNFAKKINTDRHGCDQQRVSILTTCCVLGFCWLGFSRVCKSGLEMIDDNGDDEDQCVSVVVGGVLRSSSRCSRHLLADIMCSSRDLISAAAAAAASRRL